MIKIKDIINLHQLYELSIEGSAIPVSVLKFSAEEALSTPFHFTIEFTSIVKDIDRADMLNKSASFNLYEPIDPFVIATKLLLSQAEPSSEMPAPVREVPGVITDFALLSRSLDESRYRIILQPHLALLANTHRNAIYQNISVPDVIEKILRAHQFQGTHFHLDLTQTYPSREFIMQYQESDLAFIQRIAAEVGIWFRFDIDKQIKREVVYFSDAIAKYQFGTTLPLIHPSGLAATDSEAVWDITAVHKVVEKKVTTKDYHYEDANNPLKVDATLLEEDKTLYGEPYHWGDHFFIEGSGSTPDPETGKYFARLHHERYLNQRTRLFGKTTSHKLMPGQVLNVAAGLSGLTQTAEKGILIVSTRVVNVSRDSHYVLEFEGIPYDTKIGFRPALLPRPIIAGTLPARISSRKLGDTYSFIDDQGRYRVKFNFDLDEWEKGFESVWLRLAKPYSGATYGFHFPLVDGTEIAVGFVEGNLDRPYIAHAMHDNKHPDHVTLSNHTRNVIRTPANNKLRMEDERGSEHIVLRTEHGKTQLNLGHLVDNERTARGEGFELRTDNWGSLRAGKGVFISSDVQTRAKGLALDMLPAEDQLTLAAAISEQLASAASNALTHTADTNQQAELKNVLKQLNDAGMLLSAPKGVGIVSPENLQLSSGQRNINLTAGQHTEISTLENFLVVAGKAVSLLAQHNGMNLFANNGKLDIQAPNGPLSMSALQDMSINSVQGKIEISAETEILLKSGGGYIKIANGNVELGTPNNILLKTSGIQKMGPQNLPPIFPFLPSIINSLVKSDGVACAACAAALAEGNPVNPMLGAKVLTGETDLALPGDLSFVVSRNYNSYQTDTPAPVGLFGPGWNIASEASLTVRDDAVILHDNSGRSIKFSALLAGHIAYSPSENLYVVRGGAEALPSEHRLAALWQTLPDLLRRDPQRYFITSSVNGPWWCFEPVYAQDTMQLSGRYVLGQLINQYGQTLCYVRQQEGEFAGEVIEIIDGIGRHYQLELLQIEPRINMQGWGKDSGIRLRAIYLKADPTRETLPELPLLRYEYSDRGELTTVYDRAGMKVRAFEYHTDFLGRMSAHAYVGRPASHYTYDQSGRVIQQVNPFGITYLFEYHPLKTIVRDQLGRQRIYHFAGERGLKRLVKLEQTNRSAQIKTYDIHGRLTAMTDELGRRTQFVLDDETGNIVQMIAPDGKETGYEYNAQGLRTAVCLPNGETLRYDYTAKGQLQSETDPLGHTTRYTYTATGRLQQIEDANGGKKSMTWSDAGQLARYTDCSGYHTDYQYNEWGQTVQIKGEEGQLTTWRYDAQGRLVAVADAEGKETTYEYNEAGDLLSTRYPDDTTVRSTYDPLGRPLTYLLANKTQHVEYDQVGRMIAFIDELGQRTTFEYDNMDRVIRELAFDGREKRVAFNLAGELVYSFDNDNLSEYQYDMAGRLIQTVSKNAARDEIIQTQYYYDDLGQLQQADQLTEGHLVKVSYQRDAAGRVTQEEQTVATRAGEVLWQHPVQHGYSAHGVRIQTQIGSLPAVNWLTYGSGHILGASIMGNELIEFTRDRLHRERSRRFGYLNQTLTYDLLGRLTQTYQPQIEGIPRYQHYQYDRINQLIEIQHDKSPHQQFDYDGKGRLIHIKQQGEETRYRYDGAGNREMLPISANDGEWSKPLTLREVAHNRLRQDNDSHYHYDAFGNRIQKTAAPFDPAFFVSAYPRTHESHYAYRYDAQQRLVEFGNNYYGQGRVTKYVYDAFGRRVAKINPHKTALTDAHVIFYGWDGDKLVTTQYNQEKIYTLYAPNSFVPLLRLSQPLDADTKTFPYPIHTYYCDHRGAPTALISKEGKIEWQAEYDVWGNVLSESNPQKLYQPIRLQGQHYDLESGLYYNRHRYYDPTIGRYITQDPIGLEGGTNLYKYPFNPNQQIDPLGLDTTVIVNNNGIGHVGLLVGEGEDAVLFDPGGSYVTPEGLRSGSGYTFFGSDANLDSYKQYQLGDGPKVRLFTFNTSKTEEEKLKQEIDKVTDIEDCGPLNCARCTGIVLKTIDRFKDMGSTKTPWGMQSELDNIVNPPKPIDWFSTFTFFLGSPAY